MPPKFLLGKVADQAGQIAEDDAGEVALRQPLAKFPASVLPDDQARIRTAFLDAIRNDVIPAYAKFAEVRA
jgi:uncharacterized protein (DUF885 family)